MPRKVGLRRRVGRPVDLVAVRAGGGERQALLLGLGAGVGVGELAVLLADAGDVGRLRLGREQARDDADGAAGVGDVDGLAALVARVDLHRGVDAAGGGAADQQRDRRSRRAPSRRRRAPSRRATA